MMPRLAPVGPVTRRWLFALFGAVAGYVLWMLVRMDEPQRAPYEQRMVLAGISLIGIFTAGFFAMAGRLGIMRAALRAGGLALVVTGLVVWLSLRWPDLGGMFYEPTHLLPMLLIAVLPVPFLIAGGQGNWRNYPALFDMSWEILARGLVAVFFTGAVWLVILLAMLLFDIVGLHRMDEILYIEGVPMAISGAAFGLAVAVVNELADYLSPRLIHWLLRLLLPAVALVSAIVVGAVAISGFDSGLAGVSPALLLLTIAAAGIGLVTVTLDATEERASTSPVILMSARVMVALLPILAGLSLRAVWIRIGDQGLSPNRLLVLMVGLVALAYGITWAVALLRRRFATGIRAANPWLALGLLACAVLWHTPLLNAESLSARDQARRVIDGRKPLGDVTWRLFDSLGFAGDAALQRLQTHAAETGNQDLADRLVPGVATLAASADDEAEALRLVELRRVLETALSVVPASATGSRRMYLEAMNSYALDQLRDACDRRTATGAPGCLMVIADLMPELAGEEAVLVQLRGAGWSEVNGIWLDIGGQVVSRDLRRVDGTALSYSDAAELLERWREAPPPLAPARLNQLGTGASGLLIVP